MPGEKKLVLLNFWHLDGVEKLLRKSRGLEIVAEPRSGIENMPVS